MPSFEIQAYQEMFTNVTVEAANADEAVEQFKSMIATDGVVWKPSEEELEICVEQTESKRS